MDRKDCIYNILQSARVIASATFGAAFLLGLISLVYIIGQLFEKAQ